MGTHLQDAVQLSEERERLQARIRVLEAENRRLRIEVDRVREKFLEMEALLWGRCAGLATAERRPAPHAV